MQTEAAGTSPEGDKGGVHRSGDVPRSHPTQRKVAGGGQGFSGKPSLSDELENRLGMSSTRKEKTPQSKLSAGQNGIDDRWVSL